MNSSASARLSLTRPLPPLPGLDDNLNLTVKGRSLWADARRRFFHNKAALVSLVLLTVILLLCLFGASVSPFNFEDPDFSSMQTAPDFEVKHGSAPTTSVAISSCARCSVAASRCWSARSARSSRC